MTMEQNGSIREMHESDWTSVARIYKHSVDKGDATFAVKCPSYEEWDAAHIKECRFVYVLDNEVVGFITIAPTSNKEHLKGVVEVSVFVDEKHRGQGIGTKLLSVLCVESEKYGYWTLYSSIFSTNTASIELHKKCGFRSIGYRENIAKDRFGNWRSTTLMERRNGIM